MIVVDTKHIDKYKDKLDSISKRVYPASIKGTLNSLAFDAKKNSIPNQAKKDFINRTQNFFKANSKVVPASGNNVSTMKSTVGFVSNNSNNNKDNAVKDLQQQESGGIIKNRNLISLNDARTSNSNSKNVKAANRLGAIKQKKIINRDSMSGTSWGQQIIKAAIKAGKGNYVTSKSGVYQGLWRVTSILRVGRNTKIKTQKLYSFKSNRTVDIKATHFIDKAIDNTTKNVDDYFIEQMQRQLNYLKK